MAPYLQIVRDIFPLAQMFLMDPRLDLARETIIKMWGKPEIDHALLDRGKNPKFSTLANLNILDVKLWSNLHGKLIATINFYFWHTPEEIWPRPYLTVGIFFAENDDKLCCTCSVNIKCSIVLDGKIFFQQNSVASCSMRLHDIPKI